MLLKCIHGAQFCIGLIASDAASESVIISLSDDNKRSKCNNGLYRRYAKIFNNSK